MSRQFKLPESPVIDETLEHQKKLFSFLCEFLREVIIPLRKGDSILFQNILGVGMPEDILNVFYLDLYTNNISFADHEQIKKLSKKEEFDLVASFNYLECLTTDKKEWEEMMKVTLSHVRPGGWFIGSCIYNTELFDSSLILNVRKRDFVTIFKENDFIEESFTTEFCNDFKDGTKIAPLMFFYVKKNGK